MDCYKKKEEQKSLIHNQVANEPANKKRRMILSGSMDKLPSMTTID